MKFQQWTVGEVKITRIVEVGDVAVPPAMLFDTDVETVQRYAWLKPDFATNEGWLRMNVQAFIIEAGGKRIMVDPCIGNEKSRKGDLYNMRSGPFLEDLVAAGFPRETIDIVLCTHLHFDHVGWNTILVDGQWVPTFPNARYLFARVEYEHARTDDSQNAEVTFGDSIRPVIEAGLTDLIDLDHFIVDEVRLEASPGHTPGHCHIIINSNSKNAVITGDMTHHPLQIGDLSICTHICADKDQARASRHDFIQRYGNTGTLVLGNHFPDPTGVHLIGDGENWRVEDAAEAVNRS